MGLEVKTLEKPLYVNSPLGTRGSVDKICWDCELEISGIFLSVDLRVMDISEFDVILRMDWLTTHRVVIDCDRRWVVAYTQNDIVAAPLTRPDPFRRIRTESGIPLKSLNHSKSYLCGSDCEIGQAHKHLTKYI